MDFSESIERWTILRRFLPWAARGEQEGEDAPQWRAFAGGLVSICRRFDVDGLGTGGKTDRALSDAFVDAAMSFVEPLFEEQEAWEDAHLRSLLPQILLRHNWMGKVGEAAGIAAPVSAAAGPWFGQFRYTVATSGVANVHIHSQTSSVSPFADQVALSQNFVEMAAHIKRFEPQVHTIATSTWLNSSRSYCSIFPPCYAATLTRSGGIGGVSKGFGAWGQFITSLLTLNESKAEVLRSEARFCNVGMASGCLLNEFEEHTQRRMATATAAATEGGAKL